MITKPLNLSKMLTEKSNMKVLLEYDYYNSLNEDDEDLGDELEDDMDIKSNDDIQNDEPEDMEDNSEFDETENNDEFAPDENLGDESVDSEISMDDDEIEIDMTDMVEKNEDLAQQIERLQSSITSLSNGFNRNIETITQTVQNTKNEIDSKVQSIEQNINKELVKRIPTPNEKIQLQSLHSFPFNVKLTDYWKPANQDDNLDKIANVKQDDYYSKIVDEAENEPKSYTLTSKEVDEDYDEGRVRDSF